MKQDDFVTEQLEQRAAMLTGIEYDDISCVWMASENDDVVHVDYWYRREIEQVDIPIVTWLTGVVQDGC